MASSPAWDSFRGLRLLTTSAVTAALVAIVVTSLLSTLRLPHRAPKRETLGARVGRLAAFVSQHRGLSFDYVPRVEAVSPEVFRQRAAARSLDAVPSAAAEPTLRALGLIGPDNPGAGAAQATATGFYDTQSKSVVVQDSTTGRYLDYVLVHEMTHALQDQRFGLAGLLSEPGDAGAASVGLVEGDAKRIADDYLSTLPPQDVSVIQDQALGADDQLFRSTYYLSAASLPYVAGSAFVGHLLAHGGQRAVDAAFRDPPTSTHQLLHPDRFEANDRPRPVTPPSPGGPVVDSGVLGEFDLTLLLQPTSGTTAATLAAQGWGGASYVTWTSGPRACVSVAMVMETAADTSEVIAALGRWAAAGADRHVGAGRDGRVIAAACA